MLPLPRFLLPLALVLTACEREAQTPANLSPEAAAEFMQMRESIERFIDELPGKPLFSSESEQETRMRRMVEEMQTLLRDYARSGDARLRSPMVHHTLLHLAVKYRKEALVRELLQQGADPNATCDFSLIGGSAEMDAPLAWTVVPELTPGELAQKPYRETAIRLIDMLAGAGARLDDRAGGHALFMGSLMSREGAEDVYLHLLSLGANPRLGYMDDDGEEAYLQQALGLLMNQAWERALGQLIGKGHVPVDFRNRDKETLLFEQTEELLYLLRSGDRCYKEANNEEEWNAALQAKARVYLTNIRVLLEHGADPNAPQGGGWTPMSYAAAITPQETLPGSAWTDQASALAAWQELLGLLIRHGGDTSATVPAHLDKPARRVSDYLPASATP